MLLRKKKRVLCINTNSEDFCISIILNRALQYEKWEVLQQTDFLQNLQATGSSSGWKCYFDPFLFFGTSCPIKIWFLNDNIETQESHSMVVPKPSLLCIVKYSYMYSQLLPNANLNREGKKVCNEKLWICFIFFSENHVGIGWILQDNNLNRSGFLVKEAPPL